METSISFWELSRKIKNLCLNCGDEAHERYKL